MTLADAVIPRDPIPPRTYRRARCVLSVAAMAWLFPELDPAVPSADPAAAGIVPQPGPQAASDAAGRPEMGVYALNPGGEFGNAHLCFGDVAGRAARHDVTRFIATRTVDAIDPVGLVLAR